MQSRMDLNERRRARGGAQCIQYIGNRPRGAPKRMQATRGFPPRQSCSSFLTSLISIDR